MNKKFNKIGLVFEYCKFFVTEKNVHFVNSKSIKNCNYWFKGLYTNLGLKKSKIFLLHILKVHTFENICVKFHPDRSTRFQMTAVRSALVPSISTWRATSNVRLSRNKFFWKIPLRWTWYLKNFSTDFHNFFKNCPFLQSRVLERFLFHLKIFDCLQWIFV